MRPARDDRRSATKAALLESLVPADTVRVATDGRAVVDTAGDVVVATGWTGTGS